MLTYYIKGGAGLQTPSQKAINNHQETSQASSEGHDSLYFHTLTIFLFIKSSEYF